MMQEIAHFMKSWLENWLKTRALVIPAKVKSDIVAHAVGEVPTMHLDPATTAIVEAFVGQAVATGIDSFQAQVMAAAINAVEHL